MQRYLIKPCGYLHGLLNDFEYYNASLTVEDSKGKEVQRDIGVNVDYEEEYSQRNLRDTVNYKKAEFDQAEEEIMECMITLIEERRS